MKFKGLRGDRRGVSEVLSSLLIILVAVTLGVTLFTFSTGIFGSARDEMRVQTSDQMERAEERFTITHIYNGDTSFTKISVYNYGNREITIDTIYVDNQPESSFTPVRIDVYETEWITIDYVGGGYHTIILVSQMGISHGVVFSE